VTVTNALTDATFRTAVAAAVRALAAQQPAVAVPAARRGGGDEPAGDGVPAAAGGPSSEPQDLLPQRPFSDRPRAPGRDFEHEPLVAVLGTAGDLPVDQLIAGAAMQRVLLTATDLRLAASMLSQPIEVPAAREQLRLALGRFGAPQMVLRLGFGESGSPTPRRDIDDVIDVVEIAG